MMQMRTHTCGELRLANAGQRVKIVGWMENVRVVGQNFAFVVLRDFYGTTQVVVENQEMMDIINGLNKESTISVEGTVRERASKNPKQATYASRCIENEILMYLRKNAGQRTEVSFDEPLNTDWDGKELLLSDVLGTEGDVVMRPIEADVDRKLLSDAVARLSPREKDIISLRFGLGGRKELTQKEVADRMGISQSYISRLEKRIISRLRRDIQKMS